MADIIETTFNNMKHGIEFHAGRDQIPLHGYPYHMIRNSDMIRAAWNDDVSNAESMPILPTMDFCDEIKLMWVFINGLLSDETLYSILSNPGSRTHPHRQLPAIKT